MSEVAINDEARTGEAFSGASRGGPPDVDARDADARDVDPRELANVQGAERACEYVLARARREAGHLFHQGPRLPPLTCRAPSPVLKFVAEQRVYRISLPVARALAAWGDGFRVDALIHVPKPEEVLALQAQGKRCVSLLPDGAPTAPHETPLAFALHDLCHLDKFIDPEHHIGQVGFFALLDAAVRSREWETFVRPFDEAFRNDWEHVAADMNGSCIFLMAALKMKVKMAVRREVARVHGLPPPVGGPLSGEEADAFEDVLTVLLRLLDLGGDVGDAARRTSTRRDDADAARRLLTHFEDVGDHILKASGRLIEENARHDIHVTR